MATTFAIEEPLEEIELWPQPVKDEMSAVPTAELAECCCPDFCERDHGND